MAGTVEADPPWNLIVGEMTIGCRLAEKCYGLLSVSQCEAMNVKSLKLIWQSPFMSSATITSQGGLPKYGLLAYARLPYWLSILFLSSDGLSPL